MLRNSPNAVLMMLAAVKCGAVAGMLNYHQRGDVLAHSIGLLKATAIVAEADLVEHITESGADATGVVVTVADLEQLAESASTANPASASEVQARDTAFYIFTSGTTGIPRPAS
jgi:fatty-acyl-CoA synthase